MPALSRFGVVFIVSLMGLSSFAHWAAPGHWREGGMQVGSDTARLRIVESAAGERRRFREVAAHHRRVRHRDQAGDQLTAGGPLEVLKEEELLSAGEDVRNIYRATNIVTEFVKDVLGN